MLDESLAARLRGFGPFGLLAIAAILAGTFIAVPLSALLVLVWVYLSRTPWREIGFVVPRSWTATTAIGIVFGVAFKLAMKSIVMPLLGADPINRAFHFLAGNTAALPGMVLAIVIGAGFGEELIFRSWMFERLGKLFGSSAIAKTAIVVLTSLWFGFAHYAVQGVAGTEQALLVGATFGTIYAITGRIFMLMIAHAAFDLTALTIIYLDLEMRVAHAFF